MVKATYQELKVSHLVSFKQDDSILAACREYGKSRLFLVFPDNRVYVHRSGNWELLEESSGLDIQRQVNHAGLNGVSVFRLDSNFAITQGRLNS